MKKQYTEMITGLRRARRDSGMSYNELVEIARRRIAAGEYSQVEGNMRTAALSLELEYETTLNVRHIFMPDRRFCEWLSECAKTLDAELGERAADGFGTPLVCLHFPCDSKLPSAIVGLGTSEQRGVILLEFSMDHGMGGCCVKTYLNGQKIADKMTAHCPKTDANAPPAQRKAQAEMGEFYTRMIAGLGLYITCFPEQVVAGIPSDAKRAEYAASNARTIGISSTVLHHGGVTPHYRAGHFRLLSSDRFINKRGQVVFVHGCFVNGQANTVLSPESETEI